VVIATRNPDKAAEMMAVLAVIAPHIEVIGGADWPEVEETGATLEENALLKARAVAAATGHPALADDTGLEVDFLDGRPGVHTARFAGPDATYAGNRAALLDALEGVVERRARFRTVIALVDGSGTEIVAEGILEGMIATEERGEGGFGYDPVFEVGGRTLSEIGEEEKNRISHRALALEALARVLAGTGPGPAA
jgi:XTP/dITP diphosphohydrolase